MVLARFAHEGPIVQLAFTADGSRLVTTAERPDLDLGEVRLSNGKRVRAFAREADLDVETIESNEFEIEWPPKSGRRQSFPEVDRAGWFGPEAARTKLNRHQAAFVDRLLEALSTG